MKVRPNKLDPAQIVWRDRLLQEGWYWILAYSAVEAWNGFCWYFNKNDWLYLLQE
jgi:hypothetical protein